MLELKTSDATIGYNPYCATSYLDAIKHHDMQSVTLRSTTGVQVDDMLKIIDDIKYELSITTSKVDELILDDVLISLRDMARTINKEVFIYGKSRGNYKGLRIA